MTPIHEQIRKRKPGGGRKKGEPTTTMSFRVPVKDKEAIRLEVREIIAKYKLR